MKNKKLWLLTLLILPTSVWGVSIDIDEDIREKYPLVSREMCHSSIEYKLKIPFDEAQKKYNNKMSCIFESAFVTATNQLNAEFRKKFFSKIFDPSIYDLNLPQRNITEKGCQSDDLAQTFRSQKENGYKTLCEVDGRSSVAETPYSACRVSEVVWNELCAYQEYLRWKATDRSIVNEFSEKLENDKHHWNQYQNIERTKYGTEVRISTRILEETLTQYQIFIQEYRLHLWQKVIAEALKVTRIQLKLAAQAISKWPIKFPRATQ